MSINLIAIIFRIVLSKLTGTGNLARLVYCPSLTDHRFHQFDHFFLFWILILFIGSYLNCIDLSLRLNLDCLWPFAKISFWFLPIWNVNGYIVQFFSFSSKMTVLIHLLANGLSSRSSSFEVLQREKEIWPTQVKIILQRCTYVTNNI